MKKVVDQHGKGDRWLSDDGRWTSMFNRMYRLVTYWPVVSVDGKTAVEDEAGRLQWKCKKTPLADVSSELKTAIAACNTVSFLAGKGELRRVDAETTTTDSRPDDDTDAVITHPSTNDGNGQVSNATGTVNEQQVGSSACMVHESTTIESSIIPRWPRKGNGLTLTIPWRDMAINKPGDSIRGLAGSGYEAGVRGEEWTAGKLTEISGLLESKTGSKTFTLHSLPLTDRMDVDHVFACRAGLFLLNSKNCQPLLVRGDVVKRQSTGEPLQSTWVQTAHGNVDALRGRLATIGYSSVAGMLPITPVFVMWGESTVVGQPTAPFVAGQVLDEYMRAVDANRTATLDDRLIAALESDMRRSTFWL